MERLLKGILSLSTCRLAKLEDLDALQPIAERRTLPQMGSQKTICLRRRRRRRRRRKIDIQL
jgi:hypothetical protein